MKITLNTEEVAIAVEQYVKNITGLDCHVDKLIVDSIQIDDIDVEVEVIEQ